MTDDVRAFVARELAAPVDAAIVEAAATLAAAFDGMAVLFYGSVLRTGDMTGVLDFYVLTDDPPRGLSRWLWPDVSFHEITGARGTIRAKVATMPLAVFARAAAGETLDTTIWARFVQPAALVWKRDAPAAGQVVDAIAAAAVTAASFAAVLGTPGSDVMAHWQALFRETYRAEFRVEAPGREAQILACDPDRWAALLPIAWTAGGVAPDGTMPPAERRRRLAAWRLRRRAGKPLNAARLVKASFTFAGAARYALWKVERHTGVTVPLTRWRERHPVLAAPGVLWRVWRVSQAR